MKTKIIWLNRFGERREHSLGTIVSYCYALTWFRRNILECQGVLSIDERRNSQLRLLLIQNHLTEPKLNLRCLA